MADLRTALRAILPPGIGLGQCKPGQEQALWAGEEIGPVVPKRLAEFAAGRTAARAALAMAGLTPAAIPIRKDRAPLWPQGVSGSISHCDGACFAVAGRLAEWQGLGLDLEPDVALPSELWPEILRPEEVLALDRVNSPDRGAVVLRIFVAKEAAYKAQYPISEQLFDFQAMSVTLMDQSFEASFVAAVPPFDSGDVLRGKFTSADGFVAAFCGIPARSGA